MKLGLYIVITFIITEFVALVGKKNFIYHLSPIYFFQYCSFTLPLPSFILSFFFVSFEWTNGHAFLRPSDETDTGLPFLPAPYYIPALCVCLCVWLSLGGLKPYWQLYWMFYFLQILTGDAAKNMPLLFKINPNKIKWTWVWSAAGEDDSSYCWFSLCSHYILTSVPRWRGLKRSRLFLLQRISLSQEKAWKRLKEFLYWNCLQYMMVWLQMRLIIIIRLTN